MCTAITIGSYAGRNLDIERSYGESLIITPRSYTLPFRKTSNISEHYAFFGIGTVSRGYPLYYDAANEHGLYMAGLNYVRYAKYHALHPTKVNLAPYELIPYLLSECKNTSEAKAKLNGINLVDIPFSRELPTSELHFFIADKDSALTVEPDEDGLSVYDNHVGVLANNPSFPYQLHNLTNYAGLSNGPLVNRISKKIDLKAYSRGMGALGLPGDLSSQSRFIRAVFHRLNCVYSGHPCDIFNLLATVSMPEGSMKIGDLYERTEYSSAVDLDNIIYYFKTYKSLSVTSHTLFSEDLFSKVLTCYPIAND